jgi:hypothetical protein
VEEAVNALSWAHRLAVVNDPTEHSLVRQVLAGAKRLLACQTLHDKFVTSETGLPVIRTMVTCLLGCELASLRESDVKVFKEHLEVFLESSKTDQFRDGAWVPIARTHSDIGR